MIIHSNSEINSSAELGKDVRVGPFSTIGPGVTIGDRTEIGPNVFIEAGTSVGADCRIFHGASIGGDPQIAGVRDIVSSVAIEDKTTVREFVTIHRSAKENEKTIVGKRCLLMAYAHIAHDCVVGNENVFANTASLAGHVTVGNNVILGAVTLVHQFCSLGDFSFTGLNTLITMDVPAFVKVASNPARPIGLNIVGMQRNNFDNDSVNLIKKAYRIIYRKGYSIKDAIKHLYALNQDKNPALITFISSIERSERGLLR